MANDGIRNIKIKIQYDGTHYAGWQRQKNGIGIQQIVEEALYAATGEKRTVLASGRTDAGVHALGQSANFFTGHGIPADKFMMILNNELPEDIYIEHSEEVDLSFHSIADAKKKTYRYRVYVADLQNVFLDRVAWHIPYTLDVGAMREGAKRLLGTHDFVVFSKNNNHDHRKTTVRTLFEVRVEEHPPFIEMYFTGDGFLYQMVRIMAGALVRVGSTREKPEAVTEVLEGRREERIGQSAPARGLTLMDVEYN